ncbi:MAG TPA: glycosyltransferase, partial [Gemmatales bacterium]|nr:glycosyltransferase [Gemmatales bacterium]
EAIARRIARGLQNKVLEAMAMSRPVVASAPALAGLSQRYPSPACRVETIDAWVHQLTELLSQPSLAQTLGQQGRHYVEQHYAWSACMEPLHQLLNHLSSPVSKQTSREPVALAIH